MCIHYKIVTNMVGCAVFGCSNSQRTPNINLYLIPNDNRRSEYIRRLGRADKRDDRRWRICSAHFCDSAFERNALHEYVYVNGCKRLSTIALPTENLPPTVKIQSAAATPRSERFAKRRQTDEARRNTEEVNVAIALHESVNASPPKRVKLEQQCEELSERVESLQNQLDIANSENRKLRLKLQHAERSNSYYNRRVRRAILVQQCKSRTVSKLRCSLARVSSSLAKSFTRGQLQVLQHGKRYARWTDTEIAKAIVFRKISRRGYNFVRKRMNLPLPHGSTLVRWSRCIPAAPGFVPAACILFDTICKSGNQMLRFAVLSFDEVKVSSKPSYSGKNDCVYVVSQAQTFMIRGLFAKWKTIVYYNYDTAATKDLICRIITFAENYGIRILGVVCDMGPSNVKARKELGVSPSATAFTNPANSSEVVYFFHDVPHFGTVVKLEQCFLHYYGQAGVHTCLNVVSKLAALMRSSVDCSAIPSKAVDVYAKLRVIIRMRNEGLCYDAQKVARSNSRKLRKFTN
jgi:hypothetical protein